VYLKPETLRDAARTIADAALVQLDGVGHLPMLEAPARTNQALVAFMRLLPR
jgi:pimeloyl-ACP methyl ester carboxylesterase